MHKWPECFTNSSRVALNIWARVFLRLRVDCGLITAILRVLTAQLAKNSAGMRSQGKGKWHYQVDSQKVQGAPRSWGTAGAGLPRGPGETYSHGLTCVHSETHIKILTPSTLECDLIWK